MYFESDSDSLDTTSERSDYPCQFCHNNFNNQEEVIEQTCETNDKVKKHIFIHK